MLRNAGNSLDAHALGARLRDLFLLVHCSRIMTMVLNATM